MPTMPAMKRIKGYARSKPGPSTRKTVHVKSYLTPRKSLKKKSMLFPFLAKGMHMHPKHMAMGHYIGKRILGSPYPTLACSTLLCSAHARLCCTILHYTTPFYASLQLMYAARSAIHNVYDYVVHTAHCIPCIDVYTT